MKRRPPHSVLLKLIVFIVLGAIVNVAVAWGCAYRACFVMPSQNFESQPEFKGLRTTRFVSLWMGSITIFECAYSPNMDWFLAPPQLKLDGDTMRQHLPLGSTFANGEPFRDRHAKANIFPSSFIEQLSGWPLVSVHLTKAADGHLNGRCDMDNLGVLTLPILDKYGRQIEIPYLPIWPGFAINTIFYAAILWLLFAAPLALRRRRRIKRSLCPACAYDLRGSASQTCPECGKPIARKGCVVEVRNDIT